MYLFINADSATLFIGAIIIIGLCVAAYSMSRTPVEEAQDNRDIKHAELVAQTYEAQKKLIADKMKLEQRIMWADMAEADARRTAAHQAEAYGLDLRTYLDLIKMNFQALINTRMAEGRFLAEKDLANFNMILRVQEQELLDNNEIDAGDYYLKKKSARERQLKRWEDEAAD